ncbi:MAG: type IX secretion system sortase PorU [Candidatus Kapaibacterium sp.]
MNIRSLLQMLIIISVVSALGMPSVLSAQVRPTGVEIIRATPTETVISYTPHFQALDTLTTTDGERVYLPRIVGASVRSRQFGAPAYLEFIAPLAVPSPTGCTISSIQALGVKRIYQKIAPIPTPYRDGEFYEVNHIINPALYHSSLLQEWASIHYGGIARNLHIADLSILAARYDATAQAIEIPTKIIVTLRMSGVPTAGHTSSTNDIATLPVLNAGQAKNWVIEPVKPLAKLSGDDKILSTGKWVKIAIDNEGVYKIDAGTLAKYGISVAAADVATIKIFGQGGLPLSEVASIGMNNQMREQPIIVRTKPTGELDAVLFYASGANGFEYNALSKTIDHVLNPYSKDNYYLLTYGGSAGARAVEADAPSTIINRPTSCTARVFNEEEVVNAFAAGSGRTWFGRSVDNALPQVFTTPLPNLSRNGTIYYRYSVAHRSPTDGTFTISENGTPVGKIRLPGLGGGSINYYDAYALSGNGTLPASAIAGDGRSVLKFAYAADNGSTSAAGLMNWFEIHYPQECVARNNAIEFYTDNGLSGGTEYSINGFSGEIFGFDVTDRSSPKMLKNFSSTGGMFVLRSELPSTAPKRFYLSSQVNTPRIETADVADLRTNYANSDVIVVTHPSLLESALQFKEYRESQKELTVSVVTTEQIYNEFAGGMPDVTAIRDFLGYAYTHWTNKPKYVLLWGDGHYDYKNNQTQTKNLVPPYESDFSEGTFDETSTFTSDDYFVRVVGNDYKVDMAIGRLTVPSPEAGLSMVEKIKHYEANKEIGDWQSRITLVADDGLTTHGDDGTLHTSGSEKISREFIPQDFFQSKIYMAEFPTENIPKGRRKPGVTAQLLNEVNSGTLLLNWVGHGSPRVWAHELIFERETTIPLMTNINKLFFLTAATCDFARFDNGDQQSAAEELVFSKIGGAIGIFAAARPVFPGENEVISQDFYTAMFTRQPDGRYPRLGDMMYNIKQFHTSANDEKYFLLGDPTMRLVMPENIVRIDAINDQNVTDSVDLMPLLKALSTVKINGSILPRNGGEIDTSFNGKALLTMTDSDVKAAVVDPADFVTHNILEFGGTLNRSSYRVSQGKFEASFVMPKDLSFTNEQGRLFAYAFSDTRTAKGSSRAFKVGGIVSGTGTDKTGPEISIYMDDRSFQPGNLVRKSPLLLVDLFDDTGINTTGSSIGHKIEVWFDDNPTPVDLTPSFETSLDDSRKGTAQKQIFDLAPGGHTARARAWDVLNNYSETRTNFRVATTDNTIITDNVMCYPNPTSAGTTISFQHNQSLPFTVEIHIFAMDGSLVRSITKNIEGLHTAAIVWDGMDSDGARVAQGTYLYSIDVRASNGDAEKVYGSIVVAR